MDWERLRAMDLAGCDMVYEDHTIGRTYRGPIKRLRWSTRHMVIGPDWVAEHREGAWVSCGMVQPTVPFASSNVALRRQDDGIIVITIGDYATLRILPTGDNIERPIPSPSPADALEFAT